MTVLVTGATGFVGYHLCRALEQAGHEIRRASRGTGWAKALGGVDCVVHLAARVHVLQETEADAESAFLRDNAQATAALAEAAGQAGVRRMILASTARVSGPCSGQRPFRESDPPAPAEPYERSKLEAERALLANVSRTGLESVILRIPLVYGPGVKANFLSLMRAVDRRLPLPLGSVRNCRSFIYSGNLTSAILACVAHPAAQGRTFNVSDGDDVSTPELIRRLASALGRKPALLPVPPAWLRFAARLVGREAAVERLCTSLQLDVTAIQEAIGWRPPHTMGEGLADAACWFRARDCQ